MYHTHIMMILLLGTCRMIVTGAKATDYHDGNAIVK